MTLLQQAMVGLTLKRTTCATAAFNGQGIRSSLSSRQISSTVSKLDEFSDDSSSKSSQSSSRKPAPGRSLLSSLRIPKKPTGTALENENFSGFSKPDFGSGTSSLSLSFNKHRSKYPDTPQGRWEARNDPGAMPGAANKVVGPQPNTPYTSRIVNVTNGNSFAQAFRGMERRLGMDRIITEKLRTKRFVKPTQYRAKRRSDIHRKRFRLHIASRMARVVELKEKGF